MARNVYRLPKKMWKKWGKVGQEVYNRTRIDMQFELNPDVYPENSMMTRSDRARIAHNASFYAASNAADAVKGMR